MTSARLSCSSSPKKVTLRLCCSLVNALATRRLATNFFRYQAVKFCAFTLPLVGNAHRAFRGGKRLQTPFGRATGKHKIYGTNTQCKFQPMQCTSVERTFRNLLYVYGRGRRRCGDPTIQADRFPLVNALATLRLATNFFRYHAVRLISFSKTSVAADCFCFVRRRKTRANAVRFYFPTQNFANTSFTVSSVTLLPVRLISSPRAQSMLTFTASSVSPPLSASSASLT